MNLKKYIQIATISLSYFAWVTAPARAGDNFERDKLAILKQAGCYIVDYSFTEVKSLKEGYSRDERVYDTNSNKTTYELIVPISKTPTEIRLQHVLFMKELKSGQVQGLMKHQAEDWSFESAQHFDFVGPGLWRAKTGSTPNTWVRKITNLDDGLRYQCEAAWDFSGFNPEWNCANFSPIPGRETRDMGRKDYNALDRKTRIISYENSWVERQDNVKTIWANGTRTPLAQELGRTWFIRQPDSACAEAATFVARKSAYWRVLMEVWEEYLSQPQDFREVSTLNGLPRFAAMSDIEEAYAERLVEDSSLVPEVKSKIRAVIESYRVTQ